MKLDVVTVNDPCNPSNDLAVPLGQEKDHLCMGMKGVGWTEFGTLIFDQGGDPVAIVLINVPGKPDKG
jgi:hypothetical protein